MRIKPKVRLNPIDEPGKGKTGRVNENEFLMRPRHALVTETRIDTVMMGYTGTFGNANGWQAP
jgi:hypothetical protein